MSTGVVHLDPSRFRCLCGFCHVVTGTQVCLVWYVVCSVFSLLFGMRSTLTWLIVPICVVILGVYAIISKRHKYLYPFLIITIVQQLVCMLMAAIILIFSSVSFDTMRQIIGHSLDLEGPPSTNVALAVIGGTVAVCVVLSFVHIWQAVVIYRFARASPSRSAVCLRRFRDVGERRKQLGMF
ncbi:unnamed protein product [Heligmosomoides polygyrus]|uniref:Uncharacterized protein n=1 Tax=Heligmosomoides polygyrus TaxID=6339 RepID=A0A3P7Z3G6_HELPZ|nr:unnamed protein product [Heligmosomoides polygyrus]